MRFVDKIDYVELENLSAIRLTISDLRKLYDSHAEQENYNCTVMVTVALLSCTHQRLQREYGTFVTTIPYGLIGKSNIFVEVNKLLNDVVAKTITSPNLFIDVVSVKQTK